MESSFCKNLKTIILSSSVFFLGFFIYPSPVHTVEKGETLYSISKKYEVSVKELVNANKIEGTDIKIGQKLVIPVLQDKNEKDSASNPTNLSYYTVKKGDTWYAISRLYSVSVNELYKLNNSNESESLKIGQKIIVPLKENKNTVVASQPEVKTPNSQVITPPLIKPENNLQQNRKGDSDLVWPVEKPEVTYISGKVSGVILSSKKDEVVKSIKSGTVMFSGSYRGFGNVVFIQSKTGHIYAYTGLGKVLVSKGEYIDFKTEIGRAGVDSYTSKNQISLMVFQNGLPIDPAKAPRG
ncbi:M23 family metallopeptidase [Treponema pectinovorum]|uniref:M23 family metallopeptidase n=2 Tax=Treponema pectinovorum TaxID=164 RepID=UPI0011CA56C4|nr:M23 family metallopeptidase [Treponema pectinovorum]